MIWRLRVHEQLASTQDLVIRLAQAGEPEGLAVQARRQEAGRGSRGRSWTTVPGGLALSVLIRPKAPPIEAGHWALLAGLALAEALVPHPVTLKWPNDVLLDGAKLGGVLVDSATTPSGQLDWIAIGLGANLGTAPDILRSVAAVQMDPVSTGHAVLARIAHWRQVRLTNGWAPIRAAWLARAHPVGSHLRVNGGLAGSFAGLSETGALLLQSGGRVHAIATADILQAGA